MVNKNVERVKRWRTANPDKRREQARKDQARRRATPEGRAHLKKIANKSKLKREPWRKDAGEPPLFCEICHRRKKVVPDHDHKTDKFRGWLCTSCNRGMGLLGDTEWRIANTLRYLRGDKSLLGEI